MNVTIPLWELLVGGIFIFLVGLFVGGRLLISALREVVKHKEKHEFEGI